MKLDVPLHVFGGDPARGSRQLAEIGIDGAFAFEGPHDVFIPLTLAAGAPLDLYSNIAVSFPRSPAHLAQVAWDLQHLSGGRFMLGLGSQVRAHVERRFGAAFDRPAARMADQVAAVRAIFDTWQHGTPLAHRGEFWQLDLMPPLFAPPPSPWGPPPVLVAAVGPHMTRAAARHADGILLHPFTSTRYVQQVTVPVLESALDDAGRQRSSFSVVGGAIVAMANDAADQGQADDAARALVAFYGSTPAYRPVLDIEGHGELQPVLRRLTGEGRWAEMAQLVDDEVLSTVVLRGDPTDIARQLLDRYGNLADRVAITIAHPVTPEALEQLAGKMRSVS